MQMTTALAVSLLLNSVTALGAEPQRLAGLDIDITRLSIEELLNVKITSVSKRPEQITHAPAAIYVLTADDIRRSGVTSIPEALRLVPGVDVARVDANKWAVSIRGFNDVTANKLLVLIDGRSIYDLLFGGVLWETKDIMLENVDRIEVIRGPGGSLWGANAVNGVINIITKNAAETPGGLVTAGGGTEENRFANFRYGYKLAENHYIRFYGKAFERGPGFLPGDTADDDSRMGQVGFRYDGDFGDSNTLTLRSDFYDGRYGTADEAILGDRKSSGSSLSGRWSRLLNDDNQLSLQFSYTNTELDDPLLGEDRDTFDVEFQHELSKIGAHSVTWGATYRRTSDDIINSQQLGVMPTSRTDDVAGLFFQDEIELARDRLFLTVGAKYENNDYTGSEFQPNVRLAWRINDTDTFWAAVSRAVRTPSRLEDDLFVRLRDGSVFAGNGMMDSEELLAYEAGYRFSIGKELYLDIAAFYNEYDNLLSIEGQTIGNKSAGSTDGVEIAAVYMPTRLWRISAGYSFLDMDLTLDADSLDDAQSRITRIEGQNPRQQAFIHLGTRLFNRYDFDLNVRYVDRLPAGNVPGYTVADIRLARQFSDNLELSLVGQNLFEDHHFEWSEGLVSEVEDSVYIKLLYRF